jgi:hypothetical protein
MGRRAVAGARLGRGAVWRIMRSNMPSRSPRSATITSGAGQTVLIAS